MDRPVINHRSLIVAAVLALMLRALVPTGWMPVPTGGGGLGLAPCQAWSPAPAPAPAAHGHHAAPEQPRHDDHQNKPDQPCAFAGLSLSWTGDLPGFDPPSPPQSILAEPSTAPESAVARTLAAPPPPPTGPPAFA